MPVIQYWRAAPSDKPGIAASVSKIWPNHELEVAYNYNRNVSFVDIYDYLQGNQQSIVAAWRYSVGKIYIKPYFNLLLEDLSDLELVSGTLPLLTEAMARVLNWGWL